MSATWHSEAMPRHDEPQHRGSWRSQPVAWLGVAIFVASIAGCLWLIVTGARYDDTAIDATPPVFGVPTQQPARPPSP